MYIIFQVQCMFCLCLTVCKQVLQFKSKQKKTCCKKSYKLIKKSTKYWCLTNPHTKYIRVYLPTNTYRHDISVAHKNPQHSIRRKAYNGTSEVMWILRTNVVGSSVLPVHTRYITDLYLFLQEKHDRSPYSIRAAENLTRSACVCGGMNTITRPLRDSLEWKFFFVYQNTYKNALFQAMF